MKTKEFFSKIIRERPFRWFILAGVSLFLSLLFAVYNLAVGVIFGLVWNFSVSFYYAFLTAIKLIILSREKKWQKMPDDEKDKRRLKLFQLEGIFLFLIDVALLFPLALITIQKKPAVDLGMIPTIAVAAYTTYKIIIACVNYSRSKKSEILSLHGLKIISLKEAILSIITLQYAMVATFGNATEMRALTTATNLGMYLSMLVISILQIIKLIKLKKL